MDTLSYQLPWEATDGCRFYFRLPKEDLRAARKTVGRLADPGFFPYEARRVVSPHEVQVRKSFLEERHSVLGWKDGELNKPFSVPLCLTESEVSYPAHCLLVLHPPRL